MFFNCRIGIAAKDGCDIPADEEVLGDLYDILREHTVHDAAYDFTVVTLAGRGEGRESPAPGLTPDDHGVHAAHCCRQHGCKYGDAGCPVAQGAVKQDYPCEFCEEER